MTVSANWDATRMPILASVPADGSYFLKKKKAAYLRARKYDLARDEDQEYDLGLDHTVDKTREQLMQTMNNVIDHKHNRKTHLWLITAELSVAVRKPLQANGELHVTTAHNVLNLKL